MGGPLYIFSRTKAAQPQLKTRPAISGPHRPPFRQDSHGTSLSIAGLLASPPRLSLPQLLRTCDPMTPKLVPSIASCFRCWPTSPCWLSKSPPRTMFDSTCGYQATFGTNILSIRHSAITMLLGSWKRLRKSLLDFRASCRAASLIVGQLHYDLIPRLVLYEDSLPSTSVLESTIGS
jgi:hypothetical protein